MQCALTGISIDIDLSKGLYYALLDLVWRHFNGSIDQNKFEDGARYLYTTDAHMIFTIDKLAHYIVRQVSCLDSEKAISYQYQLT